MQPSSSQLLGHDNDTAPAWQAILESIAAGQYTNASGPQDEEEARAIDPELTRQRLTIRIQSQNQGSTSASAGVPLPPEQASAISTAILRHLTRRNAAQQPPITTSPTPDEDDETTAAAAERHRLTSNSVLDLQTVAQWVEQSLPYLGILGAVFLYHHCAGLFLFLWLLGGVIKTNTAIKQQIALRREYRVRELLSTLAYVVANTAAVMYLTAPEQLWRYMLLQPPPSTFTVWDVLFTVVVLDSLVRFAAVLPKVLAVAAFSYSSSSRAAVRQQARLLTMLEYASQLYRGALAGPLWFHYLLRCAPNGMLCSVCSGVYLTLKGTALLKGARLLATSAALVLRRGALYGSYVSKEDVMEGGGIGGACPICQDGVSNGIRLDCGHIFCEECISEWLERDRTCPMCRANVKPPGLHSYGDGATSLLPSVF